MKIPASDGLTRDESGKRTDKTGERDLSINYWHRKYLSNRCYATDIDFYEYRFVNNGISPKALLEYKQAHVRHDRFIKSANSRAILHLAKLAQIRFFIVLYEVLDEKSLECKFFVWEVEDENKLTNYSDAKFSEYFKEYTNDQFITLMERL